jgi:hypothetical protein
LASELLEGFSQELRDRMQGKSCFNFRSVDTAQIVELQKRAFCRFKDEGLV